MYRPVSVVLIVILTALLAGLMSACGASESGAPGYPGNPGAPGAPAPDQYQLESLRESQGLDRPSWELITQSDSAQALIQPAPAATAAPAPASAPAAMASEASERVVREAEVVKEVAVEKTVSQTVQVSSEADSTQTQLVTQRRIIIREVDMALVVDEIQGAIDEIAELAENAGGWVVDSGRWSLHSGSISIRVPADVLDDTVAELRLLANKVDAENTSSRDVTDEYVDLGARLTNQQATQKALLSLLERATTVEAALEVQRDLTRVQEEVERLSGRIKFLEESAAFSIIRVNLSLAPMDVELDAGADQTVAVGVPVSFRATFSPPDGIDDHTIAWDFGDASDTRVIHRTAPTQTPGELTTETVAHVYGTTAGSPFIAEVSITGTGEGGIIEGKDTLTVAVSEIPAIEVFAGGGKTVDQNTEVEFSGSFTRPKGLTDVRYEWDFGDGSTPTEGDLPEGVTRATATHVYPDHRREPYIAKLTVSADSEVGEVEASAEFYVYVTEQVGFVVGGFELGDNFKTAVRGLTGFVQGLTVVVIWLAIFSPFWGAIVALVWFIVRWRARRRTEGRERLEAEATATGDAAGEAR
jgi:hypothetical protein